MPWGSYFCLGMGRTAGAGAALVGEGVSGATSVDVAAVATGGTSAKGVGADDSAGGSTIVVGYCGSVVDDAGGEAATCLSMRSGVRDATRKISTIAMSTAGPTTRAMMMRLRGTRCMR